MTQTHDEQTGTESDGGRERKPGRRTPRKLAEWVSFGVALALILGLAAFLAYEAVRGGSDFVVPETMVQADRFQQLHGLWIVPVLVHNPGRQTLRDLDVELRYTPESGEEQTDTITLDYLGQGSQQTVFFHVEHDPRETNPEARPLHYRTE